MNINISQLKPNNDFYSEICSDVWLMDNHKWAFYIWENCRKNSKVDRFSLVHADFHWDGVYSFDENNVDELLRANLVKLEKLTHEDKLIQLDSFIAPAVVRGIFESVHFYCKQYDTDIGLDKSVLTAGNATQHIYTDISKLASHKFSYPIIFDLCLDLFNYSDNYAEGNLWQDSEVLSFLEVMKNIIKDANLITISLSFDYSGTEEDTRHLASLVLPKISEFRMKS